LNRVSSIFSQILCFVPRLEFQSLVQKHKAERHARGFSCWGQFVAMLFCQLGRAHSLREICGGLAACEGKLRHLGLEAAPRRSTLAYANEHRPWELYRDLFYRLKERCQAEASQRGHRFRFKNKLISMDASTVAVSLSMFDWAHFQRAKGAVKLHLVLDHDGYLPSYAVITTGKKHEITIARGMRFQAGTILVFDKGYADYAWWKQLDGQGVYFVSRLRDDAKFSLAGERSIPPTQAHILKDQDITLPGYRQLGKDGLKVRRIEVWLPDKQEVLVLVTNHPRLAASTIAAVYRDRWRIETFFKSLKQLLKLKTFVGTSEKAMMTQIWTALIVMLLLRWMMIKATYGWSLSNLVALLRMQLFVYRDLWAWLHTPFEGPPAAADLNQMTLPLP
jgi:Domain of unknown function (DUF4372)/Transposase DDE domain